LNTGAAAIGNAGSDHTADYTALGDTVNAAFRFESATREIRQDLAITGKQRWSRGLCAGATPSLLAPPTAPLD